MSVPSHICEMIHITDVEWRLCVNTEYQKVQHSYSSFRMTLLLEITSETMQLWNRFHLPAWNFGKRNLAEMHSIHIKCVWEKGWNQCCKHIHKLVLIPWLDKTLSSTLETCQNFGEAMQLGQMHKSLRNMTPQLARLWGVSGYMARSGRMSLQSPHCCLIHCMDT